MLVEKYLSRIVIGAVTALAVLVVGTKPVEASEGTVELRNVNAGESRCFAASVLMSNFEYKILLSCRDLIYPADSNSFAYVLWGRKAGDPNKVFKLGTVGFGKGEFKTKDTFSELFVTQEQTDGVRNPSDIVVMRGGVDRIGLLERAPEPTPEPTAMVDADNNFLSPSGEDAAQAEEAGGGFSILKLIGGILVGIIVFIVIVAIVSASRRRPIE